MISKEDYEKLINNLRDKLDETTLALVSEELLALVSTYNNAYDDFEEKSKEVEKLQGEKDELLKVNGRLYQKIGFDKEENIDNTSKDDETKEDEEIKIEDVIDEKGDLI